MSLPADIVMEAGAGRRRGSWRQEWPGTLRSYNGPAVAQAGESSEARMGMRGDLAELALSDLIEMTSLGGKTGRLVLCDADGQKAGELAFRDGRLVGASYGSLRAEKAFYGLLDLREGSFDFDTETPVDDESCNLPTASLLMEGMRRIDEIQELRRQYPAPAVVGMRHRGAVTDDASEARVLGYIGPGARSVGDIVDGILVGGEFDEYDALKALGRLHERGIVVIEVPKGPDGEPLPQGGPPQPELER